MSVTKELKGIPGLNPEESVIIKKLGYGSLSKLRSKSAIPDINVTTKKVEMSLNLGEYAKWLIIYGVDQASFFDKCTNEHDKERVIDNDELSAETGEFLFKEIEKLNNFTGVDEVKKN